MPSNPDKLIIRAMIPNEAEPPEYVLDQAGLPPQVIVENSADVIHEVEFQGISADVVGTKLSVAEYAPHKTLNTKVGWATVAAIQAEPVDHESVTLKDGYDWKTLG